jgi:PEGA domain
MSYKNTRSNSTTRTSSIPGDGWAAEAQRSGSSLQQHLALGMPASHQDADNDNDDTTLFRRPGEWVSQLSSLVGRQTPEKWEELDHPFKRSVPAAESVPQPPAARARPPRPVAAAPRNSLEPVQAIEGGLQRSLRPTTPRRRWALALSLPLFAALGGLLAWNTPRSQWPLWKLPTAKTTTAAATRGLQMPLAAAPATPPPPAAEPLAAAVAAQPEPLTPVVEDIPEVTEPVSQAKPSPRDARRTRAAARRARRAARSSQRIQFTRNITPLPLTSSADDAKPSDAAATGTLQINSRPWARVMVDGKFVGHTPQRGLKLAAGWHRIRLINEPLGMSKSLDIEIRAGQTARYVEMLDEDAVAKP